MHSVCRKIDGIYFVDQSEAYYIVVLEHIKALDQSHPFICIKYFVEKMPKKNSTKIHRICCTLQNKSVVLHSIKYLDQSQQRILYASFSFF